MNQNESDNYEYSGEYIDRLAIKLKIAKREVKRAECHAEWIDRFRNVFLERKKYLAQYRDKIEATNELAKEVINTLDRNKNLVRRAAINVELTNDAAKLLIEYAENAANETEDIVAVIEDIKQKASVLTQPPAKNGPILQTIYELSHAVEAAVTAATDALMNVLETYQKSGVLLSIMGDEAGNSGLTRAFAALDTIIHNANDPGSKLKFPREGAPMDIWDRTKAEYDRVNLYITNLQEEYNKTMEVQSLATAKVQAIKTSLEAAKKAAAC